MSPSTSCHENGSRRVAQVVVEDVPHAATQRGGSELGARRTTVVVALDDRARASRRSSTPGRPRSRWRGRSKSTGASTWICSCASSATAHHYHLMCHGVSWEATASVRAAGQRPTRRELPVARGPHAGEAGRQHRHEDPERLAHDGRRPRSRGRRRTSRGTLRCTSRGAEPCEEEEVGDRDVVAARAAGDRRHRTRRGTRRTRSRNSTRETPIATSSMTSTPSRGRDRGDREDERSRSIPRARWRAPACRGYSAHVQQRRGSRGRRRRSARGVPTSWSCENSATARARRRRAHRGRSSSGSASEPLERVAHRRRRSARRRDRSRRRRPLRASRHFVPRPPARRTRRLRGTRCRSPRLRDRATGRGTASRTRRRSRGAARARRRAPVRGSAPGRGSARFARARSKRGAVAARARDRELHVGQHGAIASMSTSNPLRGTSRLMPSDQRPIGVERRTPGAPRPAPASEIGSEAIDVDAGRDDTPGSGRRAARTASRAEYSLAATTPAAACNTARAELTRPGEPAGHRHLGAVHDTTYGAARRRGPSCAERQPRVEEDHVGTDLARERVDAAARATASEAELRLLRAHDAEPRTASHSCRPRNSVVSTVVSLGGSRRHSS